MFPIRFAGKGVKPRNCTCDSWKGIAQLMECNGMKRKGTLVGKSLRFESADQNRAAFLKF
jgi:hypothetical protein